LLAQLPRVQRHATQLDMLAKLKRMAPFTKDAEHEFLVNMYKLRGTFAAPTPGGGDLSEMVQESTDVTDGSRRKSGGAAMFEKLTRGATLEDLGFDAGNVANARSTQRVVEVYERRARGRSERASGASARAERARERSERGSEASA
jgi:hypothetical protein